MTFHYYKFYFSFILHSTVFLQIIFWLKRLCMSDSVGSTMSLGVFKTHMLLLNKFKNVACVTFRTLFERILLTLQLPVQVWMERCSLLWKGVLLWFGTYPASLVCPWFDMCSTSWRLQLSVSPGHRRRVLPGRLAAEEH